MESQATGRLSARYLCGAGYVAEQIMECVFTSCLMHGLSRMTVAIGVEWRLPFREGDRTLVLLSASYMYQHSLSECSYRCNKTGHREAECTEPLKWSALPLCAAK